MLNKLDMIEQFDENIKTGSQNGEFHGIVLLIHISKFIIKNILI